MTTVATLEEKLDFMTTARTSTLATVDAVTVNAADIQLLIDLRKTGVDLFDSIEEDIKYADKARQEAKAI